MRLSAAVVPYPRVWASRPAFINRLNQMNEEVRARVGVRVRVRVRVRLRLRLRVWVWVWVWVWVS